MNKITTIVIALTGTIALFSLSSCKKIWDEIKHHPDGAADNCNIEQIAYTNTDAGGEQVADTTRFLYNNHGDPEKVTFNSSYTIYRQDKLFKYDNQHRLIAYLKNVPPGSLTNADFWHTYTYVGASKIIDSTFEYANGDITISPRPEGYAGIYSVVILELDSWGRIIKANGDTYTYNAQGNLVKPGVTYTNKTNIRQTNKIWMFIDRDYSINEPEGQVAQFNSNKLPYKYNDLQYYILFDSDGFWKGTVTYSCH